MTRAPKTVADIRSRVSLTLMSEVSEAELAVRMIEAGGLCRRPDGRAAEDLLAELQPETRQFATSMARAAMLYMAECFGKAVRPS